MDSLLRQTMAHYEAVGITGDEARAEAEREIRLTTGDPYLYRTDEELEAMRRVEMDQIELARQTAGVCDEFPNGEFAVPGFNCDFYYDD